MNVASIKYPENKSVTIAWYHTILYYGWPVWPNGSVIHHTNKDTLCWAWLVLGWVIGGVSTWYVTKPTRLAQPCIPRWSLNRVSALIGCSKGGNVTSAGWQVTLCDPMRHVSSRSSEAWISTSGYLHTLRIRTQTLTVVGRSLCLRSRSMLFFCVSTRSINSVLSASTLTNCALVVTSSRHFRCISASSSDNLHNNNDIAHSLLLLLRLSFCCSSF